MLSSYCRSIRSYEILMHALGSYGRREGIAEDARERVVDPDDEVPHSGLLRDFLCNPEVGPAVGNTVGA
jgi:hypothetical protein